MAGTPHPFGLEERRALLVGPPSPPVEAIAAALTTAGATVSRLTLAPGRDPDRLAPLGEGPAPDIVVHCALARGGGPLAGVTPDDLAGCLDGFVRDGFLVGQAALAAFARRPAGASGAVLIHVVTPLARVGAAERSLATMAMHALRGLTAAMAVELGPLGIRVNAIEVSAEGESGEPVLPAAPDQGGLGASVVYVASDAAVSMTGASLCLDAGWTAR